MRYSYVYDIAFRAVALVSVLVVSVCCSVKDEEPEPSLDERVEQLAAELRGSDEVATRAVTELARIGADADAAIPALVHLFETTENEDLGRETASALGRIGPAAIPALLQLLQTTWQEESRSTSARADSAAVGAYVRILERGYDDDVARRAAWALGQIGPDAVTTLVDRLRTSSDADVVAAAAIALRDMGPDARCVLPELIRLLQTSEDTDLRLRVTIALENIGPNAPEAAPVLLDMFANGESRVLLFYAANAIRAIGSDSVGLVPARIWLMEHEVLGGGCGLTMLWRARRTAWEHLNLGVEDVPALIRIIRESEKTKVLRETCRAIGKIGPEAGDAVPALVQLLERTEDDDIFEVAIAALGKIGPDAVPALNEVLSDSIRRPPIRVSACEALGNIGPDARDAVPVLVRVIERADNGYAIGPGIGDALSSVEALGRIGPDAVPALEKLLVNAEGSLRDAIEIALNEITWAHPSE